jgi:hypothetical protein
VNLLFYPSPKTPRSRWPAHPIKSVEQPWPAAATTRKNRPHTILYLGKKVQRVIKEIALQYDRKPHDVCLEGINLMLTQYGRRLINDILKD